MIDKNRSEMAEFNKYMEHSVKEDPVFLISNYSRVKSSNYMIYKMLENATPEDIDSYRQLIVALPEFQEGFNASPGNRNIARYNKSIETILKNQKLIFNIIDSDLNDKLQMAITKDNKDKLGLKDINDLNDVDVIVADILSEPKPESEILKELSKTPIYRTTMDGEKTEIEASEYLPESIKKLEFIGYFTKK